MIHGMICVGEFGTDQRSLNPQRPLKKMRPDSIGAMVLRVSRSVPRSIEVPQL